MRHRPKQSMVHKIAVILCGTAILQGFIFVAVVLSSETFPSLKQDAFEILNERVSYRSKNIEAIMNDNIHNENMYADLIESTRRIYHKKNKGITDEQHKDLADELIRILNSAKSTGAFMILDQDQLGEDHYPVLYLRDSEPTTIVPNNGDITALYGISSIIKQQRIALDPVWSSSIPLQEKDERSDFYFIPFHAAEQFKTYSMESLGYWSTPFRISEDDIEVITYSMPLLDENNEVYGVIGLEYSVDFIASLLNYEELDASQNCAYILGILNADGSMENPLITGPAYTYLRDQKLQFNEDEATMVSLENANETTLGNTSSLSIYSSNTPFSSQQWSLIGVVKEQNLLSNVNALEKTMLLCIIIAVLAALIAAVFSSIHFSRPIKVVEQHLKHSFRADGTIALPRVNISEIDQLSTSIEELSRDVAFASSRLSQILHAVNIQVGAVDYSRQRDHVFCTEMVAGLLGISDCMENMSHKEFDAHIQAFLHKITYHTWESGSRDTDQQIVLVNYQEADAIDQWLRFHVSTHEDAYLVVIENVSDEMKEKLRLEHERDHDALTSLLNRRAFKREVEALLQKEFHTQGVMVMWDLDNLKYINDTYGHDIGDRYIRSAAALISKLPSEHAIVARMAGDEFLAYIHSYPSIQAYKRCIRDLHASLGKSIVTLPDNSSQPIRASAGISWYPQNGATYDDLLKHADYAMYHAKNTIKGSIKEFNSHSYAKDQILFNGKEELNTIIEQNQVRFHYQPIVDAKTGEIFGYEALMRPDSEHIKSPLDLFRLAKAQSKLYQMEVLTWVNVIEAYVQHPEAYKHRKVFLNSIPNVSFYEQDWKRIEALGKEHLSNFVIEIIESDDLDLDCMKKKQEFADRHHLEIAIDDFGSGYNNEGMLLKIVPNYIKIDMEIIQGVSHDPDRERLVSNIIQFAHTKSAMVIAEGIENMSDLQICIKLGVDLLQGFYLGKPKERIMEIRKEKKELIRSLSNVYEK